ncbi:MAG: gamma-glutamyltransferase [Phycisphaerales bacterium]
MLTNPIRSVFLVLVLLVASGCSLHRSVRSSDSFHDRFARGAVAADHPIASDAGAQMLAMGGNAVDAAVASSFALSVVRPYSCGIGGGGFMVIHLPNDPTHGTAHTAINYRETSPYEADWFQDGVSMREGGSSVAVPGTVAGLLYALEHYGTLDRAVVLKPAIDAALEGFVVDEHYQGAADRLIRKYEGKLGELPAGMEMIWTQFLNNGQVQIGDRIVNPEQARALQLIARDGLDAWTSGEIGRAIIQTITDAGGGMQLSDLAAYQVSEVDPIEGMVDGKTLIGMPPPSSGGVTMFQTLGIMERAEYDFSNKTVNAQRSHLMIESLKHAFADRSRYLADPAFTFVPTDQMLDSANITRMAGMIDSTTHQPEHYGTSIALPDDDGTSHVSVIDQWGGGVAMTETINFEFGSKVGVREFGFVLNNEMDDFTNPNSQPNGFGLVQSDRNLPQIGKRPLSSMSPTIVLDERGGIFAIAGASGGPRIITGTMQTLLNVMSGMDAGLAVAAPRVHHQWMPNQVLYEQGYSVQVRSVLSDPARMGHETGSLDSVVGNVQVIVRDADGGWQAASDPRKGGRPSGID